VKELKETVAERDRELEATTLEMLLGSPRSSEALKAIAAGNPSMRIPEDSGWSSSPSSSTW